MGSLLPPRLSHLPEPSPDATAHGQRLCALIAEQIASAGGWISFARYMELALHAPGLGYYSAGSRKLGAEGDFVTAPELGSLFGRTLARQAAQILSAGVSDILEFGAGSGRLARDLLSELAALDCLPQRYLILETSAGLRRRQFALLQHELPQLASRIAWLDALPASFSGLMIANEVIDAMPVHVISTRDDGIDELGVIATGGRFEWGARPATRTALDIASALGLASGYVTEIHPAAQAFMRTLAAHLERGAALLIDYGFPAREYYHPQRSAGTLMCHYRHHAHSDPLCLTGLQDITAHVDFSALAAAATAAGLELLGYVSQAQFLINCGITEVLAVIPADNAAVYLPLASQAQKLTSPAEMGELFKVIAFGRGIDAPLLGFNSGDRRHTL